LSGKPPVKHGEDVLHPELQLLLALMQRGSVKGLTDIPAPKKRLHMRRESLVFAGRKTMVGAVADLVIPTPAGGLAARHYAPRQSDVLRPLLVFFHGGGFSVGDIETHDVPCRLLCHHAGIHVLSVDYRLAPECPFPAALEDGEAAFQWAVLNGGRLGADPTQIGIGGDSAGATIATVVTQSRAARGERLPDLQLLIYPVIDCVKTYASKENFGSGFLLTTKDIARFGERYAPGQDPSDPRLSPLFGKNLSGLAPAIVVTAAFDPLRDEGEIYAQALQDAGTQARVIRMPGMIHAFINLTGLSDACLDATTKIAHAVAEHWQMSNAERGAYERR